ncbi:piggyBac transposable element-derived protein 3-like [Prorops nasuta]|uniref:piggyBac transposable element-derived protein 3-like n=1 Tax=Prorops nasuta TaxID=863751 RepID=UPI0034CD4ABF
MGMISKNMKIKRFFELRSTIHFSKINAPIETDRFWKVRPLFDDVRQGCLELPLGEKLGIVEQMPNPWGVKLFVLCNSTCLIYDSLKYQGKRTDFNKEFLQFGQGAAVVIQLTERISNPQIEVYFDNYFTTFHLLEWLKLKNLKVVGTLRINRFYKPPYSSEKLVKKNEKRGFSENVTCKNSASKTANRSKDFLDLMSFREKLAENLMKPSDIR